MLPKDISLLEKRLQYIFNDKKLLILSLTHSSAGKEHNERLEFLGDAVMQIIISIFLFFLFLCNEGTLSKMRAKLVNKDNLLKIAKKFKLNEFIIMSDAERKNGGENKSSILCNTLEAIIGAIYIDCKDLNVVINVIYTSFFESLNEIKNITNLKDFKTELQEYMQSHKYELPIYVQTNQNEKTHKTNLFIIKCSVKNLNFSTEGKGTNKKEAEQEAAKNFLIKLKSKNI